MIMLHPDTALPVSVMVDPEIPFGLIMSTG
jgi:hypothetical protein